MQPRDPFVDVRGVAGSSRSVPGARPASREHQPQGDTLSDNEYLTVTGTIEFDPEQKEANNKQITSFTVTGPGQIKIRVTVWPELKIPAGLLKKGLPVGVRGKYTQNGEYHNISATSIGVGENVYVKDAAGPGVASKPASTTPSF